MDFFGAQEQARRRTRWLLVLFMFAVMGVVTAVYLAVMMIYASFSEVEEISLWDRDLFLIIAGVTLFLIASGSITMIIRLAMGGGKLVAESLGGRRVMRYTKDPLERRLLNVVDEMAIASGVAVPKVYILDEEQGINAFAAGFTTQQTVVAVTRGTLVRLSRDELQGVIAHEFSHILNGDMRLNLRLIGILHGILIVAMLGRLITRNFARPSKQTTGVLIFGISLVVIGYIGVFFGNLIKAAASRQREFLADASAVQFTRNPAGIVGALKKIVFRQSAIQHYKAEEVSHMFFGDGYTSFFDWFATHPPIEERIRRIDRSFRAEPQRPQGSAAPSPSAITSGFTTPETVTVTSRQVMESVGTMQPHQVAHAHQLIETLPSSIRAAIDNPEQARSLIYALLVADEPLPIIALQQGLVDESVEMIEQAAAHVAVLKSAGRALWLPILEMVIPELDVQDGPGVEHLLANTKRLIEADGRVTLVEYLIDSLLRAALGGKPGDKGTIHRYPQTAVNEDGRIVLSLLAHLGHRDRLSAQAAFQTAISQITGSTPLAMIERASLSLHRFEQALTRLATLDYRARARVIEACTSAITHDDTITIMEAELLRIIGAKLDCPIPPLMADV